MDGSSMMKQTEYVPKPILESVLETIQEDKFGNTCITLVLNIQGSDTQIAIELSGLALEYSLSEIHINN